MIEKKTLIYWCFLLAVVVVAGAVLTLGRSQARYVNTAIWNTIAEPGEEMVTSDFLYSTSDTPVTVLLGEMSQEDQKNAAGYSVKFQLESKKGVTGALTWSVDQTEYLDVAMHMGATQLQQGSVVGLAQNDPVTITMTLTATAKAATETHDALPVQINVSWAGVMKGTFLLELPAVTAEESSGATEETTATEATESAAEETTSTEPTQTETPTEPQPVNTGAVLQLSTIPAFTTQVQLPVTITADAQSSQFQMGIAPAEETQTTPNPFPKYTRYSVDNGESYYMLYSDSVIWLDAAASQLVLLDFSGTTLNQSGPLELMVNAWSGATLLKSVRANTTIRSGELWQVDTRVLEEDGVLQIQLTPPWQDYPLSYSMQKLTLVTTELGDYKQYTDIDPTAEGFVTELIQDETGTFLTIRTGEDRPPAGTYALNLNWTDGDVAFGQTRVLFFVNYFTQPQPQTETETTEQTGGAER